MTAKALDIYDPKTHTISCRGEWNLHNLPDLEAALNKIHWPSEGKVTFDGDDLQKMDSSGAWLLLEWEKTLEQRGLAIYFVNFPKHYQSLLALIKKSSSQKKPPKLAKKLTGLAALGEISIDQYNEFLTYLTFIGSLSLEFLRVMIRPFYFRWNELAALIYKTGYQALPIIALLAFMIGVSVSYQMGIQLLNYGANIYIVDLLGISMLREFGPLLTAIMVSGRTGSSFTAQLGLMKINQEIDALDTMGVTPAELLIIPRIIALLIVLPLLTMWANIFGVLGGMVMANSTLNITWYDFIHRFPMVVHLKALLTGLGKTPIFALIIASIGCFQGIQVERNADSIGQNTTRSVVLAIFFIIVADAAFSVLFSKLKL